MSERLTVVEADIERRIRDVDIVIFETDIDTNNLFKIKLELTGFKNVITFTDHDDLKNFIDKGITECLFVLDVPHSDAAWYIELSEILATRHIPSITITAVPSFEEMSSLLTMGASDVIVKPFDMGVFILKVEKVLTEYFYDRDLTATYERNESLFLNILQVMARVIEARFPYVQFHSENVSRYARLLATRSGMAPDKVRLIGISGVLHDLGKIGVREEVLNKPGPLTDEEYEIVKMHPVIASEVLNPISEMNIVLSYVRHHHEWFDGSGYPDKLHSEDIPVGARILHIAEAYETMIGERVYKKAFPKEEAVEELIRCRGTQFDPDLTDLFIDYLRK